MQLVGALGADPVAAGPSRERRASLLHMGKPSGLPDFDERLLPLPGLLVDEVKLKGRKPLGLVAGDLGKRNPMSTAAGAAVLDKQEAHVPTVELPLAPDDLGLVTCSLVPSVGFNTSSRSSAARLPRSATAAPPAPTCSG